MINTNEDPYKSIYKEDLEIQQLSTVKCPSKNLNISRNNILIYNHTDNGDISDNYPICELSGNDFKDSNFQGCCIIDQAKASNEDINYCPADSDTFVDISYLDRSDNTIKYHICHSDNLQNLRAEKPGLVKFAMYAIIALIVLIVITIVGCSYEFWLQYGSSFKCLYYKSKYDNRGKNRNKVTLLEYIFPDSLAYYPYQPGMPCPDAENNKYKHVEVPRDKDDLIGGSTIKGNGENPEFVSMFKKYKLTGEKCITIHDEDKSCERNFPYNIPDMAESTSSEFLKIFFKVVGLFYIIPMLIMRIWFKKIITFLANKFERVLKTNITIRNFVFLFLSGLLAPTLAIAGINIMFLTVIGNPFSFLGLLVSIASIIGFIGWFFTVFFILFPKTFLKYITDYKKSNSEITKFFPQNDATFEYYKIDFRNLFIPWTKYDKDNDKDMQKYLKRTLVFFLNILKFPIIFLFAMICISFSLISQSIASITFPIATFFQIFYYPLANIYEFYNIVQSHGDLLTLIFCVLIFVASSSSLNPETKGIMGFILAVICFIKVFAMYKT